jgi:hypothetical protein
VCVCMCTVWRASFGGSAAVLCVVWWLCNSTRIPLTLLSQDQTLDSEPANSVTGFLMLHFLWFLTADTNNSRITLATETNRRTPEASSGVYKSTSKEEINRQFLVLQNCRRYPYVQYCTAGCVLYINISTIGMVHLYVMVLAGSSLSPINHK